MEYSRVALNSHLWNISQMCYGTRFFKCFFVMKLTGTFNFNIQHRCLFHDGGFAPDQAGPVSSCSVEVSTVVDWKQGVSGGMWAGLQSEETGETGGAARGWQTVNC